MTEHKHAALLRAIADEGIEAAREFECTRLGWTDENWVSVSPYLSQLTKEAELWQVRRKPKMIKIGDVEFPEPVRERPAEGTKYFVTSITSERLCSNYEWFDFALTDRWLKRGLVHLTEEGARQHAEALIKLSGGTV